MKKLILFVLLTTMTASYSLSQGYQIPLFNAQPITTVYENGSLYAKIPIERARLIDQWARRGVEAKIGKEAELRAIYLEKLMEQIREAKLHSDSVSVTLSRDLLEIRNQVSVLSLENTKLQQGYLFCQSDNQRLSKEVTRLKAKVFWKDVSKVVTYTVAGLAALVLITN